MVEADQSKACIPFLRKSYLNIIIEHQIILFVPNIYQISENGECSQIDPPLINGTNGQIQEEVARELAKKVRLIRTFSMLVVVEVFSCFFISFESKVSHMVNCDAF